jgi:AcrR family transcriptional regulator
MCPPPSCREFIVDAAEAVVIEVGAAHMTLDAVAAKAGVSKGGLLYHFPTKETLLQAMLDRHIQRLEEAREKKYKELQDEPGRAIKAYVISALTRDRKTERISAALLAAVAHDPQLLKPVRNVYQKHMAEFVSSGLGFEGAAVIALATDGLRLLEILSLSPFNKRERKHLIEVLLRLADTSTNITNGKTI